MAEPILIDRSRQKFLTAVGLLLVLHLLVVGAIALFFQPSTDRVILRYNAYFGIDLLATWWQVYLLPLLSFTFSSVNLLIAFRLFHRGERLLSMLLLLGSGVIAFGLILAIAAIVYINY